MDKLRYIESQSRIDHFGSDAFGEVIALLEFGRQHLHFGLVFTADLLLGESKTLGDDFLQG